jgi:hypothetical protein
VPDPSATLPALAAWDGTGPKVIKPALANAAQLVGFPAYPLRYRWTVVPFVADSATAGDSLMLQNPTEDGSLEVGVCVDNGGAPSCAKATLEVKRKTVSLAGLGRASGPLSLMGGRLAWNAFGRVRILDWRGRILWERWGAPGTSAELPARAERSLRTGSARLEFQGPGRRIVR